MDKTITVELTPGQLVSLLAFQGSMTGADEEKHFEKARDQIGSYPFYQVDVGLTPEIVDSLAAEPASYRQGPRFPSAWEPLLEAAKEADFTPYTREGFEVDVTMAGSTLPLLIASKRRGDLIRNISPASNPQRTAFFETEEAARGAIRDALRNFTDFPVSFNIRPATR